MSDQSVQGTNDDAQLSKMSCVQQGYFKDDFIKYFVKRPTRRAPLINRGYYSRYASLRMLLEKFLSATEGKQQQVLVLGCGFDTTWFHLQKEGRTPFRYVEVDFPEVTRRKASIITATPVLAEALKLQDAQHQEPTPTSIPAATTASPSRNSDPSRDPPATNTSDPKLDPLPASSTDIPPLQSNSCSSSSSAPNSHASPSAQLLSPGGQLLPLHHEPRHKHPPPFPHPPQLSILTPHFSLLPADLRNLEALGATLSSVGFDWAAPTYVLAECVLVYMDPDYSSALVRWLGQRLSCGVMAVYEQIKPDDAFGRQMVSHLQGRGCPLLGLRATPTLLAHEARFTDNGWRTAHAVDMDTVYRLHLDPADRARIEKLELFDEFEEWHMIQEHYSITVAVNDDTGLLHGVGFKAE